MLALRARMGHAKVATRETYTLDLHATESSHRPGPRSVWVFSDRPWSTDVCIVLPRHPRLPQGGGDPSIGDTRAPHRRGGSAGRKARAADPGTVPGRAGPPDRAQHGRARRAGPV